MKITTDEHKAPILHIHKQGRTRPVNAGKVAPAISITKTA
jgi:hypothetical protein